MPTSTLIIDFSGIFLDKTWQTKAGEIAFFSFFAARFDFSEIQLSRRDFISARESCFFTAFSFIMAKSADMASFASDKIGQSAFRRLPKADASLSICITGTVFESPVCLLKPQPTAIIKSDFSAKCIDIGVPLLPRTPQDSSPFSSINPFARYVVKIGAFKIFARRRHSLAASFAPNPSRIEGRLDFSIIRQASSKESWLGAQGAHCVFLNMFEGVAAAVWTSSGTIIWLTPPFAIEFAYASLAVFAKSEFSNNVY